jgi:hypothetical protein
MRGEGCDTSDIIPAAEQLTAVEKAHLLQIVGAYDDCKPLIKRNSPSRRAFLFIGGLLCVTLWPS